MAAQSV